MPEKNWGLTSLLEVFQEELRARERVSSEVTKTSLQRMDVRQVFPLVQPCFQVSAEELVAAIVTKHTQLMIAEW